MQIQNAVLEGNLCVPEDIRGMIIFAYGNRSDRLGLLNDLVAEELMKRGWGTMIVDLLTEDEKKIRGTKRDIDLLTERLIGVTKWCMEQEHFGKLQLGYFGTGMGSAAVLSAAAYWGMKMGAVVSAEGRADLAMEELDLIEAPVLLIVMGKDKKMVDLNRRAYIKIGCLKKMEIIKPEASSFGEEAEGAIGRMTSEWFEKHLV